MIVGYQPGSNLQIPKLAALNGPAVSVMLFEVAGSQANISDPKEAQPACSGNNCFNSCVGAGNDNMFCNTTGGQPYLSTQKFATGYMGGRSYKTTASCLFDAGSSTTPPGGFDSGCVTASTGLHLDGSNFLLCDGHVKWFRGSQVSNGVSAATPTDAQDATATIEGAATAAGTQNEKFAITFSRI